MIKHEHKKQLHDRILERCAKMKLTLVGLRLNPQTATSERVRAIDEALAALQTHMSGGWDAIDESESAALGRWLESSRFLFDAAVAATPVVVAAP